MSKKYKIVLHNKKCQKWITNCWLFSIFFLDILTKNWIKANVLPDDNGKLFFYLLPSFFQNWETQK